RVETLVVAWSGAAFELEHLAAVDAAETIAGVELDVLGQAVGGTGHEGIGETPVPGALVPEVGTVVERVVQVVPDDPRAADAGAVIRRDAVSGAVVDIGVGK